MMTDPVYRENPYAFLFQPGVAWDPSDQVAREQCDYCGDMDAWTTYRVIGDPRDDVAFPIEDVNVCGTCAPNVVAEAVGQLSSHSLRPVQVEVAVDAISDDDIADYEDEFGTDRRIDYTPTDAPIGGIARAAVLSLAFLVLVVAAIAAVRWVVA